MAEMRADALSCGTLKHSSGAKSCRTGWVCVGGCFLLMKPRGQGKKSCHLPSEKKEKLIKKLKVNGKEEKLATD